MSTKFDMIDLLDLCYFLGFELTVIIKGLLMHQMKYITDILKRFNMMKFNSAINLMEGVRC